MKQQPFLDLNQAAVLAENRRELLDLVRRHVHPPGDLFRARRLKCLPPILRFDGLEQLGIFFPEGAAMLGQGQSLVPLFEPACALQAGDDAVENRPVAGHRFAKFLRGNAGAFGRAGVEIADEAQQPVGGLVVGLLVDVTARRDRDDGSLRNQFR